MDLEVINRTKKQLELKVKGENETLLNPIVQELLKMNDVEYATIETDHPNDPYRRIYIRLIAGSKKEPISLLKEAVKQVKKVTTTFRKEFENALPAK